MNTLFSRRRRDFLIAFGLTALIANTPRQFCYVGKREHGQGILMRAIMNYEDAATIALILPLVDVTSLHLEATFYSIFKKRGRPRMQSRFFEALEVANLILTEIDLRGVASGRRHRRHSGSVADALKLVDEKKWPRLRHEVARLRS